MEGNVLVGNIVGCATAAIGVFLYAYGVFVDGKFVSWKTFVGFGLAALGGVVSLIICGQLP